jgi:RHS repeat-associated protein
MPRWIRRTVPVYAVTISLVTTLLTGIFQHATSAQAAEVLPTGSSDSRAPDPNGEVVGLRTPTSRTFLAGDGNYATYIYPASVNYRASDGSLQPIDPTLVSAQKPSFAFKNRSGQFQALLPANLSTPMELSTSSGAIDVALDGAVGTGSTNGNVATYGDAFGGADVTYQVGVNGIKESILFGVPRLDPITWHLTSNPGLSFTSNSSGGVKALDATGNVAFTIAIPIMSDATGAESVLRYQLSKDSLGTVLSVTPDAKWEADPARVFPLVLDPSITPNPVLDCRIAGGAYADTNFCGANDDLRVGVTASRGVRTLMKFDVTPVPVDANILSSDLALYLYAATNPGAFASIEVHRVTNTWTSGVTWNKRNGTNNWGNPGGDFNGIIADSASIGGTGTGYKHWYPVGMVQNWVEGSQLNQGLIIKQATETVDNLLSFRSVEYAQMDQRPYLMVLWNPRPGGLYEFTYERRPLSDRMGLKVNVGNGNLVLQASDLQIAGTKLNLGLARTYNSLSTDQGDLGPGWVMSTGTDIRLEDISGPDVLYHGPSGEVVRYASNGSGGFLTPRGIDADLSTKQGGGWTLTWFSEEKWDFDAPGKLQSMTDKNGNDITFAYNPDGSLGTITDTQNRTVSFSYVGSGTDRRLDYVTDNAGNRTFSYAYDNGYLTGVIDPVNGSNKPTAYTYSGGLLTKITDPRGHDTILTYDAQRRVSSVKRVLDPSTQTGPTFSVNYFPGDTCSLTANVVGKTVFTDENGHNTTYCYDKFGQVEKTIDALNNMTNKTYTSHAYLATLKEAGVTNLLTLSYDANNNSLTQAALPSGGTATFGYGGTFKHFPTSVRDFANDKLSADPTWVYTYGTTPGLPDYGNIKTAKNNPLGITFTYAYNPDGTLDTITDGRSNLTDLNYTGGNLTSVDPPGPDGTLTFTYDCVSRVATATDGIGQRQTYVYDALDRVLEVDYEITPNGPPASCGVTGTPQPVARVVYTYDENGNMKSRFDDVTGTTNFTYDDLNRLTKETPEAPFAETDYTYWPTGALHTVLDDTGTGPTTYTYFDNNTLQKITDQQGHDTVFAYNGRGLRTSTTYPNGVVMAAEWDNNSRRLTSIRAYKPPTTCTVANHTNCYTYFAYSYQAPNGNDTMTRYKVTDKTNAVINYRYDVIGRLTMACPTIPCGIGPKDFQYGYDANGNLTTKTVSGSTTTYKYDVDNTLCWALVGTSSNACTNPPTGATWYSYDNDGNLLGSSQGLGLAYNAKNQTKTMTPPGSPAIPMEYAGATQDRRTLDGTQRMAYSQLGLNGQGPNNGDPHTTYWVRDDRQVLVSEHDATDQQNQKDYYYLFDGLGSVVGITDWTGSLVASYAYEPYGKQTSIEPTAFNPWRFASGYYDQPVGTLKFGTRYYLPDLQRWTQGELGGTIANPTSLNDHLYVADSPASLIDPSGRYIVGDPGSAWIGSDLPVFDPTEKPTSGGAPFCITGGVVAFIGGCSDNGFHIVFGVSFGFGAKISAPTSEPGSITAQGPTGCVFFCLGISHTTLLSDPGAASTHLGFQGYGLGLYLGGVSGEFP